MVFASLTFLYIFLPLNLLLYYSTKNATWRNLILTIFSFVFYAWGEPIWIALLFLTALIDYANGRFIEANRGKRIAKIGVICSLVFNIGTLLTFKYSAFIVSNVNDLLGTDFTVPGFALPIGISFYTFQSISYVMDVYTGKVTGQKSLLKFLMFVSLYHQLVAGPIVRYVHIANEIDKRRFNIVDISAGVTRFLVGLFKKVCVANVAGVFVQKYLAEAAPGQVDPLAGLSVAEGWFGIIMFTIQIYFDFSGYSDMAIGLGRMFGFHYYENFNYPYIAKSATDFWRRWHISLSTWFRDYIYIPLGGNKNHGLRNLFIVWLLTGIWHGGANGACWNYILWGLFWGLLILLERVFFGNILRKIPAFFGHIYLLIAMVLSWALFYFTDMDRLWHFLSIIFGATDNKLISFEFKIVFQENLYWMLFAIIMCMPVYLYIHRYAKRQLVIGYSNMWWTINFCVNIILLGLATMMLVGTTYNPFIYYRF
ncbi:MAG: MBOAT family protein [Bacteroidota bacterium]|nr:MBOAT family protein [Bacteroidota bacterium]